VAADVALGVGTAAGIAAIAWAIAVRRPAGAHARPTAALGGAGLRVDF
jgi:hypothetical protein